MNDSPVLLVRINCVAELANTSQAIDSVKQFFPGNSLVTISSPRSEALDQIEADPRIEKVHIVTFFGRTLVQKLKSVMPILTILASVRATVICYGATPGLKYNRHILTSLFFGGTKYIIGPDSKVIRLLGWKGLAAVFASLSQTLTDAAAEMLLLSRYPTRRNRADQKQGLLNANDRVLVIRLDSLGDVVSVLPVAQAISDQTGAKVDMLVRTGIAPILSSAPFIGTVYGYDHVHMKGFDHRTHQLVQSIRSHNYDVVVELTGNSFTARLFGRISGSNVRVGLIDPKGNSSGTGVKYLTKQIPAYKGDGGYTSRGKWMAEQLGIPGELKKFVFVPSDDSISFVNRILSAHGPVEKYAVLHMKASTVYKSWPVERFKKVSEYLIANHNLDIVLSGSSSDTESNEALRTSSEMSSRIHNFAGEIPLDILPTLYSRAQLVVTVDTGPAHIASATGTPLVVLGFRKTAPFGRQQSVVLPISNNEADNTAHPLYAISVQNVIDAIEVLLPPIGAAIHPANTGVYL